MAKLILIRHGETVMNFEKRFFGKLDYPLNQNGINQAEEARKKISNLSYDNIYTSSLKRAKQTAEICNFLNLPLNICKDLEEIDFGIYEGLTYKEICNKFYSEEEKRKKDWENYNHITGESPKDLYLRVKKFLDTLDFSKNNLIVSHWGVINIILTHFLAGDLSLFWKFKIDNGSVAVLDGNSDFMHLFKLF